MATRGAYQLLQLNLYYCEKGGSSRAMREYISKGGLVAWAERYPKVRVNVKVRNGHHPYVLGNYRTSKVSTADGDGSVTAADLLSRSQPVHQISLKKCESWKDIDDVMTMLYNRSGRKITKITNPILTQTPSIQGVWTPFLDLYGGAERQQRDEQLQQQHDDDDDDEADAEGGDQASPAPRVPSIPPFSIKIIEGGDDHTTSEGGKQTQEQA